jgi:hypothetical protein
VRRVLSDQNDHPPVRLYEKFDDIDWMKIIKKSSQLDVIIHYLDTWTRNFSPALTDILKRGGNIRVILPNHKQAELVYAINTRFPKLTEPEISTKISRTHEGLLQVLPDDRRNRGIIETYFTNKMIWYSAFCLDNKMLYLSPFEHERAIRIQSPVTEIDLDAYPEVRVWLQGEMKQLIASSVDKQMSR